jgi:TetR/AcrR family fatty acid metabolism transcriptional regulator
MTGESKTTAESKTESKESLVEEFRQKTILQAAMRVIARKGAAAVTMQEIADEAKIAKGTIYLYFEGREELVDKAAEFAFSELIERSERVLTERGPVGVQLREVVKTQIAFFDQHQEFLRVYMSMRYGDDCAAEARGRRRGKPRYQRYLELLSQFLERGMERGEVKRGDPARLASFLAEGISVILLSRLQGGAPAAEAEGEWIVDLMLNGISTRKSA